MKKIYICKNCISAWAGDGSDTICPNCKNNLTETEFTQDQWHSKTEQEKEDIKKSYASVNYEFVDRNSTSISKNRPDKYKTIYGSVQGTSMSEYGALINRYANMGWEYVSMNTFTKTERSGCLNPQPCQVQYYVIVFKKI